MSMGWLFFGNTLRLLNKTVPCFILTLWLWISHNILATELWFPFAWVPSWELPSLSWARLGCLGTSWECHRTGALSFAWEPCTQCLRAVDPVDWFIFWLGNKTQNSWQNWSSVTVSIAGRLLSQAWHGNSFILLKVHLIFILTHHVSLKVNLQDPDPNESETLMHLFSSGPSNPVCSSPSPQHLPSGALPPHSFGSDTHSCSLASTPMSY